MVGSRIYIVTTLAMETESVIAVLELVCKEKNSIWLPAHEAAIVPLCKQSNIVSINYL